jgi:hypothetical protein
VPALPRVPPAGGDACLLFVQIIDAAARARVRTREVKQAELEAAGWPEGTIARSLEAFVRQGDILNVRYWFLHGIEIDGELLALPTAARDPERGGITDAEIHRAIDEWTRGPGKPATYGDVRRLLGEDPLRDRWLVLDDLHRRLRLGPVGPDNLKRYWSRYRKQRRARSSLP